MTKVTPKQVLYGVIALLGLLCAVGLWRVVAAIGLQVPLDPNEGWNAYHATAVLTGKALYPPAQAYLVNNYPPLSYYVVALFTLATGDAIVAGRAVALLALFGVNAGMWASARALGARSGEALLAPLLFTAGLLLYSDYAGMDDPQMLAHAVSMAGFVLLLGAPRTPKVLAGGALLFVTAFFVKHAVIAMPVAITLWLFLRDRRSAFHLAAWGIGFLIAGLIVFRLTYGISLLSVVATARTYSLDLLRTGMAGWLQWGLIPIAGLIGLIALHRKDPGVQLCAIYAAIGLAIGIVFIGGAGVDPNVLFDADIALSIAASLLLAHVARWRTPILAALYAAPLILFAATNEEWQNAYLQWRPLTLERELAGRDIAFMRSRQGPALCEMLSFCYWSGKPPTVDVFNVGQQFETGARSDAELVQLIERKHFAVIQFDPDSPYSLGEDIHNAMERTYRVHHEDGLGTFYVPR